MMMKLLLLKLKKPWLLPHLKETPLKLYSKPNTKNTFQLQMLYLNVFFQFQDSNPEEVSLKSKKLKNTSKIQQLKLKLKDQLLILPKFLLKWLKILLTKLLLKKYQDYYMIQMITLMNLYYNLSLLTMPKLLLMKLSWKYLKE